ncbi:MAG: cytochrome C [Planctomycetes bacterium]|nr:cytochrome C [Planctomycetota bacterium]
MPQIFHPSMNTISRATIFGAVFILAVLIWLMMTIVRSPYVSGVGVIRSQPVPFSHEHHVAEAGIDCRYCHTSVEQSSFAGIPPTQTCMNCHSQLWTESPMLEPVRASYQKDKPLVWNRVHDLPDFAYFYHNIHVERGVACTTCHGQLAEMPLTWKTSTLYMEWCLECHRDPEKRIGPLAAVFASAGVPSPIISFEPHADWKNARCALLTNCSVCHH